MCRPVRWALLSALVLGCLAVGPAPAAVEDEGNFFSRDAVKKANARIADTKEKTKVDLVIETFEEIPKNRRKDYKADKKAAFFFRSAQRFFIARPIRLRAAADKCRLRPSGLPDAVLPALPLL